MQPMAGAVAWGAGGERVEEHQAWAAIKAAYMERTATMRDMAARTGISESSIYKRAARERWKEQRDRLQEETDRQYIKRRGKARAQEMERIASAADRMAALLDRTVEELEGAPAEVVCKQLKGLAALGSAIKSTVDSLMLLNGVQTPAQQEAQKIARARLKLEQRKLEREERLDQEGQGARKVELTINVDRSEDDEQIAEIKRLCMDPELDGGEAVK